MKNTIQYKYLIYLTYLMKVSKSKRQYIFPCELIKTTTISRYENSTQRVEEAELKPLLEFTFPLQKGISTFPGPWIPRESCLHESERWNHAVYWGASKGGARIWNWYGWFGWHGWLGGWVVEWCSMCATWRIAVSHGYDDCLFVSLFVFCSALLFF